MAETQPLSDSPDSVTTDRTPCADVLTALDELYADCNGQQIPMYSSRCESSSPAAHPPSALIADEVVSNHSAHDSWTALAAAAPWDITDRDTLDTLPREGLDAFLAEQTEFSSGAAFFEAAAAALLAQPTRTMEGA
jgi:hypothetical protein